MRYLRLIARRFDAGDPRYQSVFDGVELTAKDFENPGLEVSMPQQARMMHNLELAFGDGWILDAPEIWSPASQGALGIAALSAATVGEAFATVAAYVSFHAANQRLTIIRENDTVILRHSLRGELPASWAWAGTLTGMLFMAETLKLLAGPAHGARYEFVRAKPDYCARLEGVFGGEIRWLAGSNAIILPASAMDISSPFHDPITHEAALQRLEQARHSERAAVGVRDRIEHLLANSDQGRLPSRLAARLLGISQRTLARRLAESGVSYRDLVDVEIDAGALSHAEISERLGFSDATSFSRACRRWFKATA
jgi:AraC-like DNA-binding protein